MLVHHLPGFGRFIRLATLGIALVAMLGLSALACSSSDDDDDDDEGGGDGGPMGGGDDDASSCDRLIAVGDGIAERTDTAWVDITPDLFGDGWHLSGLTAPDCDEQFYVGRDEIAGTGIALRSVKGAFAVDEVPAVSSSFDFSAIDSRDGLTLAAGGDWFSKTGFVLGFDGEAWTRYDLPFVSGDWWLTDVVVIGKSKAAALGIDLAANGSILLRFDGDAWTVEEIPGDGARLYSLALADSQNGLAVGRHADGSGGAIAWLSEGTWYAATPPPVSSDWTLADVAMSSGNTASIAGRAYDLGGGIVLDWIDGAVTSAILPGVSTSWDLRSVAYVGDAKDDVGGPIFAAAGVDHESGGGVVLRSGAGVWATDGFLPFALSSITAF